MNTPPTVLFICQHNAGRSQMGAHLLDLIAPGEFVSTSAGVNPADEINPVVAQALEEAGADTTGVTPRQLTAADVSAADVVVAMKPGLELPGPVTGRRVDWEFPNPEHWNLESVRRMRDEIAVAVRDLVAELRTEALGAPSGSHAS